MKLPTKCHHCSLTYDHALARICPYCGESPHPEGCPDPLCILDMSDPTICQACPRKVRKHRGWGGHRPGAGAPPGNLNRLVTGGRSRLLRRGIEKLAADPELRAVLLIIARLADEGAVPLQTRKLIRRITKPRYRTRKHVRQVLSQGVK